MAQSFNWSNKEITSDHQCDLQSWANWRSKGGVKDRKWTQQQQQNASKIRSEVEEKPFYSADDYIKVIIRICEEHIWDGPNQPD